LLIVFGGCTYESEFFTCAYCRSFFTWGGNGQYHRNDCCRRRRAYDVFWGHGRGRERRRLTKLILACVTSKSPVARADTIVQFSPIGLVGIPACIFAKGFLVSYSVSAIFRALGLDGIWLALTAIGFPNFVYIPALVIVSILGLRLASGDRSSRTSPYFHAVIFCVFVGLAAFQAYLQPWITTWLLR